MWVVTRLRLGDDGRGFDHGTVALRRWGVRLVRGLPLKAREAGLRARGGGRAVGTVGAGDEGLWETLIGCVTVGKGGYALGAFRI